MNRSSRTLVFCSLIGIGLFSLVNALPSSVGIEGVETINKLRAEDWLRNQIGYVVGETSTPSGERLGVSPPCAPKDGGKQKPQIPTGRTPVSNPESAPGDSPNSENPKPNTANESLAPLSPLHPIFSDILFTSLAAEAEGAELVGLTVQMDLPELGLTGEAILTDIQTTPRIEAPLDYRDERQVVTATFRHSSGDVIDLVVADSRSFLPGRTFAAGEPAGQERKAENGKPNTADAGCESLNSSAGDAQQVAASREVLSGREDQQEAASDSPLSAFGSPLSAACEVGHSNHEPGASEETIGTTSNHPFWSVDRQEFVQAGSLEIGERLQTLSGDVKVVQQKLPRPGPQSVFNLEVHNEHVYFVGQDGVLVHNSYQTTNATGNVALGQRLQAYKAWKASKGITGQPTSQQFKNFVTGNTGKNGGGFYVASGFGKLANDRNRRLGVSLAWKAESLLLQQGTPSRPWTVTEQLELLSTGKVSGYHGHHINSVSRFPHLAADPRNIKFLSPTDHLAEHFGSWRNSTSGPLRTDF